MKSDQPRPYAILLVALLLALGLFSPADYAAANTLTIDKVGDGSGTVRSQAAGIDCGAACSNVYLEVVSVTLSAIPDSGSYFTGWSGGCVSQALSCTVPMITDITVTATFSTTPPTVTNWVNSFSMNQDAGNAVLQTRDGGYIVAGQMNGEFSSPGLFSVIKLNTAGEIVWKKHYEGSASSAATTIREDDNGNYIVGGRYLGYSSSYNPMIIRIDGDGNLLSAKALNTSNLSDAYNGVINGLDLDRTGVILAGSVQYPESGNNNMHLWIGEMTFVVDPVLPQDSPRWQIAMGGDGSDAANSVRMTSDGGSIVAGETTSFGAGGSDAWLIKLQIGGIIEWQKTYGGSGYDSAKDIVQITDGGFVVAGTTGSPSAGAWVARLDSTGDILWQNVYGAGEARSIQQTIDGGYIVAGSALSASTGNDAWLMKLNADGSFVWRRSYGSATDDDIRSVLQAADGGYILTGRYASGDMLVLKTDENGAVYGCGLDFSTSRPVTPVAATAVATTLDKNNVTINKQPGFNGTYAYTFGDMAQVTEDITLTGSGSLCSGAGPTLSVTPWASTVPSQWYNIGGTKIYTQITQIVTIANNGNLPLNISSFAGITTNSYLTISPTGGSRPCSSFQKSIAAGDFCTATITYTPFNIGSHYGDFRLISNDPNTPTITMRYTATCALPVLEATSMVSFGLYKVQQPSTPQFLTLKNSNATTGDLQIGAVTISGTNADEFSLTANNCPATLAPQATCTLEVTFTPNAAGSRSATLNIVSSDPISPTRVTLTGSGGYLLTVFNLNPSGGTVINAVGEGDPDINCGFTCTYLVNGIQTIKLNATSELGYLFSGWSGEGCSGTGTCSVTMSLDRTVTAGFDLDASYMVYNQDIDQYFGSFQSAYDDAQDTNILLAWGITSSEDLTCSLPKTVFIMGGYDTNYSSNNGMSILNGKLVISAGRVTVENISVK